MRWIIAYDIAEPKRLARVAGIMEDFGTRVQKSVFEMEAGSGVFERLRRRLDKVLDFQEDRVRYYPLCGYCSGLVFAFGRQPEVPHHGPWQLL